LHTREPLRVIEGCARRAHNLVITEMHRPELDGSPVARLYPTASAPQWDTWWSFSPDMLVEYLGVLGFSQTAVTFHEQTVLYPGGEVQTSMFTIVASPLVDQTVTDSSRDDSGPGALRSGRGGGI
jgi:hypothetical protein